MTARERIERLRERIAKVEALHTAEPGFERQWRGLRDEAVEILPALLDIAEAAAAQRFYHGYTDEKKCRCGLCVALAKLEGK